MKIQGLILGNPQGGIVTDGRTLRGMEKSGHLWLVHKGHPYVDYEFNGERRPRAFTWHGQKYRMEYFSGCFYPFVVKVKETPA
jgi:hypothetical protein